MSREIKFRAWDINKKVMFRIQNLLSRIGLSSSCWKCFESNMGESHNADDCYLMQYTGLKDKNGVEICEGDIVSFPYITPMGDIDEYCYTGKIEKLHGSFCLIPIKYDSEDLHNKFNPLFNWCITKEGKYISNYGNEIIIEDKTHLEVIGNIHENKELLE